MEKQIVKLSKTIERVAKKMDEKFLLPFYLYLDTGENTIKKANFLEMHNLIVEECDSNDKPEEMLKYCKHLLKTFVRDKIYVELEG